MNQKKAVFFSFQVKKCTLKLNRISQFLNKSKNLQFIPMSLEIVDLDESSDNCEMKLKIPIRTYNDLPYLRKDYVHLMKPLQDKISVQQIQIRQGNEQIQILLRQLGSILNERARLFRRIGEIKGFFNDKQNKRYKLTNMTKKEAKAKLDKCDNILETTINQKDLIKADALNNMALFAQQKAELSILEREYKTHSSVAYNSINASVREKIAELNLRLENFHVFTEEEFQEKLNLMEMERNSLILKLMEKEKQEERARRQYKNYIKQQKEEEKQAQKERMEKEKKRNIINEDKPSKSKTRSKSTGKDIELNKTKKPKNSRYMIHEDNEYDDYDDDKNYQNRRKIITKIVKNVPQTTRVVTRTRRSSNRQAFNADRDDDYENDDANYKIETTRPNRTKRKSKSPKLQNTKKILDENEEIRKKSSKSRRPKSATVKEKRVQYKEYDDDENDVRQPKPKSYPNSPQKKSKRPIQKTTKRKAASKH